jgi:hypothetical protein
MSEDIVNAGKAAWQEVHRCTSFENWKAISLAVSVGRQAAMSEAKVNGPRGARYARIFNGWLNDHGFASMSFHLRTACCAFADHMQEIETWRAALPDATRQNNPEVYLRNWRRSTRMTMPKHHVTSGKRNGGLRPVSWPQDHIRRAAANLRQSTSRDLFVLARAALEGAIRSRDDLLQLLDEPTPGRIPAKAAPSVEAALA